MLNVQDLKMFRVKKLLKKKEGDFNITAIQNVLVQRHGSRKYSDMIFMIISKTQK